jgi:hypothetical protein
MAGLRVIGNALLPTIRTPGIGLRFLRYVSSQATCDPPKNLSHCSMEPGRCEGKALSTATDALIPSRYTSPQPRIGTRN